MLEDYWLTRQGLELPESARPKSAPTSCRVNDRSASTPRDEQAPVMKSPRGKVGVLQCIEGVLRGGALDSIVNSPVLLVTSTQDALDTSNTAEVSGGPKPTAFIISNEWNTKRKYCLFVAYGLFSCECGGSEQNI